MYKVTVPTIITNGHFDREKTLKEIKRCGAERIALALDRELDHAFSSEENLKLLKDLIQYFRENRLEVLVWLGETFGHDGGKPLSDMKYKNMRFIDKGDIKAFCPLDKTFAQDFCLWVKKVAECGADMIMLDDDFRLGYRDGLGCCCPLHMKALEDELGEKIEERELKQKLFDGGANKYRSAWLKVQGESIKSFAQKLRNALDEVNPKARLGFCTSPGVWDAEGWDPIETAKIMAGDNKPFLRTMGAPYWATQWPGYALGEIIEIERNQINRCRQSGIEIFSEGDTYPRPRYECPASYLECFDTILRADGTSDGILKYMLDYVSDADYETGYIDAMVKNEPLYKEIEKSFSDKECVGVRPYNVVRLMENAEFDISRKNLLNELQDGAFYPSLKFAVINSLPVTYDKGYVNILFGENAKYISKEDLKFGNIIDIKAAEILIKRGIDVGAEKILTDAEYEQRGFTDLPSEYYLDEGVYTRLDAGVFVAEIKHKAGVRPVTKYRLGTQIKSGAYEYENAEGMRFLVYPFDAAEAKKPAGWFGTYARKRQLLRSIEWLGKKPLDIYASGNYPNLYILSKKNNKALCAGLWNLFDDKIENAEIKITCKYKDIRFINCSGHKENDSVILDTVLYPYEFAGFELLF